MNSPYAYVTVLYGNNIYLTGAMVLGFSLMKTKTLYDRIILVTPDVSLEYITYLKNIYTHVIDTSYVEVNPTIFSKSDTRFRDVFTKLSCLKLISYDKILLLDLDMIICKNIDHLFKLEPPAACIKFYNLKFGEKINPKLICDGTKLVGSINAGLMLLKPDMIEWDKIKLDIKHNTALYPSGLEQDSNVLHSNPLYKFKYPEQDYLSLRYCHKWTSITFNYNFQFGLTHRVKQLKYAYNNIYVIHYSSSYKPWNDLVTSNSSTDKIKSKEEIKFRKKHLKYYRLWNNIYDRIRIMYELNI